MSRFAESRFIPCLELVVRGIPRQDRSFVSSNRHRDAILGDICAEHRLELGAIAFHFVQPGDDIFECHVHLDGILHRSQCLMFQRRCPTIPELEAVVGRIDDRRRIATSDEPIDACSKLLAVAPTLLGVVTGGARHSQRARQPRIKIQLASQCDLLRRGLVVSRMTHRSQSFRKWGIIPPGDQEQGANRAEDCGRNRG